MRVSRSILTLSIAATLTLAGCGSDSSSEEIAGDADTGEEQVSTGTDLDTGANSNSDTDDTSDEGSAGISRPGGTPTIDGNNLNFGNDPKRMSLGSGGLEISDAVSDPSFSDDGRYILFGTFAPNVVEDDIDEFSDVFLRDTISGSVTQVSVGVDGSQGNNHSHSLDMSADGRYLLFSSFAQNLIPVGARGGSQLYLHDSQTAVTTLVSAGTDGRGGSIGTASGFISADGELIVYESAPRFVGQPSTISLYRRSTGETRTIDLYRVLQTTELLGPQIHALTPDGRLILLSCCVTEVNDDDVNFYIYHTTSDAVELLPGAGSRFDNPSMSDDGQIIVYANGLLLNRRDGSVKELNLNYLRTLSPDGRWLPYTQIVDANNSENMLRDNLNDVAYVTNRFIYGFTGDGNNAYEISANTYPGVTDTNNRFDVYLYDFPLSDLP